MLLTCFGMVYAIAVPDVLMSDDQDTVECIKAIIQHYSPGKYLLFFSPVNELNESRIDQNSNEWILDYTLYEINKETNWSLIVIKHSYSVAETIFKFDSCLIFLFIDDKNALDITSQMEAIHPNEEINNEARYIIVIMCKTSMLSMEYIKDVFSEIWETYMLLNILAVVPNKCLNSENISETKTTYHRKTDIITVDIYSWFPYSLENNCTKINKITLIDSWIGNDSMTFQKKANLYPEKIPLNLQKCPMKVATRHFPPTIMVKFLNNKQHVSGIEINIILAILESLNLTIEFVVVPTLSSPLDENAKEVIFKVVGKEADFAIASLPLHEMAITVASPTVSYFETTLSWIVPCPKVETRFSKMVLVFSLPVWLCIFFNFIFVAVITSTLSGKFSNFFLKEISNYSNLYNSLYNIWSVLLGVSVFKMPKSNIVRIIFLLWVLHCFSINTVFEAFFTTYLVQPGSDLKLSTVNDLIKSGIPFGYPDGLMGSFDISVQESDILMLEKRANKSIQALNSLDHAIKHGNFATISPSFYVEYYKAHLTGNDRHLPVCKLDDDIVRYSVVSYLRKGNPILRRVNEVTRRLLEGGIVVKMMEEFMNQERLQPKNFTTDISDIYYDRDYFVFTLSHLQSVFKLLAIGCALGMIVLLFEIAYFKMGPQNFPNKELRNLRFQKYSNRMFNANYRILGRKCGKPGDVQTYNCDEIVFS